MKPAGAQVSAEGLLPAAPASLSDQLKQFASGRASIKSKGESTFRYEQAPFAWTQDDAITEGDLEFLLKHQGTNAYTFPEEGVAAEQRKDEIAGKLFRTYVQFSRSDGFVPQIESEDFIRLSLAFAKHDATLSGLREQRKSESLQDYVSSLGKPKLDVPDLSPFDPPHDYRKEPLGWAADYSDYLDYLIGYLEREHERWFDALGRSAEERALFWNLNVCASFVMRDAYHPGAEAPAVWPDLEKHVEPLLDAAHDILMTKAHRQFKLAPEQELDLASDYAATVNMGIVAQHQADTENVMQAILDTRDALDAEAMFATSVNGAGRKPSPRRTRKDAPAAPDTKPPPKPPAPTTAVVRTPLPAGVTPEMIATLSPNEFLSPFYNQLALSTRQGDIRTSLLMQQYLDDQSDLMRRFPAVRLLLGAASVPFNPVKWRIDQGAEQLARSSELGTWKEGWITEERKRKEIVGMLTKSGRANEWVSAMSSVALDLLIAAGTGTAYHLLDAAARDRVQARIAETEAKQVTVAKTALALTDEGRAGFGQTFTDMVIGLNQLVNISSQVRNLSQSLMAENAHSFIEWKNNATVGARQYFGQGVQRDVDRYFQLQQERAIERGRQKLNETAQYRKFVPDARGPSPGKTEEQVIADLARRLSNEAVDRNGARRAELHRRLEPLVGKAAADSCFMRLSALSDVTNNAEAHLATLLNPSTYANLDPDAATRVRNTLLADLEADARKIRANAALAGEAVVVAKVSAECNGDRTTCSAADADSGAVSFDVETVRAVSAVHLVFQELESRGRHVVERISRNGAQMPRDMASVSESFREHFKLRGWDVSEHADRVSAAQRGILDAYIATRQTFSYAWQSNDNVLTGELFTAIDEAHRTSDESHAVEVVLPYSGGQRLVITPALARQIAAGNLSVPEEWKAKKLGPEEIKQDSSLSVIVVGGGTRIVSDRPGARLGVLYGQLARFKDLWTSDKAHERASEEARAAAVDALKGLTEQAYGEMESLLNQAFRGTVAEVVEGDREAMDRMVISLGKLASDTAELTFKYLDRLESMGRAIEVDTREILANMECIRSLAGHSDSLAHASATVITRLMTRLAGSVDADPEKNQAFADNRAIVERFLQYHFGESMRAAEETMRLLHRTVADPDNVARATRQAAYESMVRDVMAHQIVLANGTREAFWKDTKGELRAIVAEGPRWFREGAPEDLALLSEAERNETAIYLEQKFTPALTRLAGSEQLRSLSNFSLDVRVEAERTRLGQWLSAKMPRRANVLLDFASKAAYCETLMRNFCHLDSMKRSVVGATRSAMRSVFWAVLSGGDFSWYTMRLVYELLRRSPAGPVAAFIAQLSPVDVSPDKFFPSMLIKLEDLSRGTDPSDMGTLDFMKATASLAAAIAVRAGIDLTRQHTATGKSVQLTLNATQAIVRRVSSAYQSAESGRLAAADYAANEYDPIRASAKVADSKARDFLDAMKLSVAKGNDLLAAVRTGASTFACWGERMMRTNSPIGLGISGLSIAMSTATVACFASWSGASSSAALLGVAAGASFPVFKSLTEKRWKEWKAGAPLIDVITGRVGNQFRLVNLASGSVGERWVLVNLLGNVRDVRTFANAIARIEEVSFEDPTTHQRIGDPRHELVINTGPGDTPFARYRNLDVFIPETWKELVEALPPDRLSPSPYQAFLSNAFTEDQRRAPDIDERARRLFEHIVADMQFKDTADLALVGFRDVGSFWTRSGLAIIPSLVASIVPSFEMQALTPSALAFVSSMPRRGSDAMVALATTLGRAFSSSGKIPVKYEALLAVVGIGAAVYARGWAATVPDSYRAYASFGLMIIESAGFATAVSDLFLKLAYKERAESGTISMFMERTFDLIMTERQDDASRREKIQKIRDHMREHIADAEAHLLQFGGISGSKTSWDSLSRTGILLSSLLMESTLWAGVSKLIGS